MIKYNHEESIGFILNNTTKLFQKVFDYELNKNVGLGLAQSKVIYALYTQPGLTQRELADKIGIETPTLVSIIDKLEKEKLVKREIDKTDRRIKRIVTTSKADKIVDFMIHLAIRIKKISTKNISEKDLKKTLDITKHISQNLKNHLSLISSSDYKK